MADMQHHSYLEALGMARIRNWQRDDLHMREMSQKGVEAMTNELTIAVARALCETWAIDDPDEIGNDGKPFWMSYIPDAKAAIAIVLEAAAGVAFGEQDEAEQLSGNLVGSERGTMIAMAAMAERIAFAIRALDQPKDTAKID